MTYADAAHTYMNDAQANLAALVNKAASGISAAESQGLLGSAQVQATLAVAAAVLALGEDPATQEDA